MLPYLMITTLGMTNLPQATKRPKHPAPATRSAPASKSGAMPMEPGILRQAPCVMALKGSLVRRIPSFSLGKKNASTRDPKDGLAGAPLTKEIKERFEYDIPGTLEEQAEPSGVIRFRFKPTTNLAKDGARMSLRFVDYLEDTVGGTGGTPVVVDGLELTRVDPFVFEAGARGRDLLPVAGQIFLRGRMQGPFPPGSPLNTESPIRPIVSNPLPPVQGSQGFNGPSYLRFQGASLWAWQNTKGPFTVAATITYQGRIGTMPGTVNGTVDVVFRVGEQFNSK